MKIGQKKNGQTTIGQTKIYKNRVIYLQIKK